LHIGNDSDVVLRLENIVKRFDTLVANDNVSFTLKKGEILGILGENGAGKTTLMNVVYGLWSPDSGEMYVYGKKVNFKSPRDAINEKIGMICQHYNLVPTLTVSENITLPALPRKKYSPFFDKFMAQKKSLDLAKKVGFNIKPDVRVEYITVGEQQKVEILKALYQGAEILILDEPTAILTNVESDELFNTLENMKENGSSILFITHKLREAMKCDRIIVLREGKLIIEKSIKDTTQEELRAEMFGENKMTSLFKKGNLSEDVVFEVKELSAKDYRGINVLKNISFKIHNGEIFGVAGVAGNGQSELAEIIAGVSKAYEGNIFLNSKDITSYSNKKRRSNKLGFIPEERYKNGILIDLPIYLNVILGREEEQQFSRNGLLKYNSIFNFTEKVISDYEVKTNDMKTSIRKLSGGNIQKLLVAREFAGNPDLIVANQPTRGLDLKTTDFVREKLYKIKELGKAVLLFSYDLDEIFLLSDRIGVLFEGNMVVVDADINKRKSIEMMMVSKEVNKNEQ
jgi:general nucleoside transport system ATP-binding protein